MQRVVPASPFSLLAAAAAGVAAPVTAAALSSAWRREHQALGAALATLVEAGRPQLSVPPLADDADADSLATRLRTLRTLEAVRSSIMGACSTLQRLQGCAPVRPSPGAMVAAARTRAEAEASGRFDAQLSLLPRSFLGLLDAAEGKGGAVVPPLLPSPPPAPAAPSPAPPQQFLAPPLQSPAQPLPCPAAPRGVAAAAGGGVALLARSREAHARTREELARVRVDLSQVRAELAAAGARAELSNERVLRLVGRVQRRDATVTELQAQVRGLAEARAGAARALEEAVAYERGRATERVHAARDAVNAAVQASLRELREGIVEREQQIRALSAQVAAGRAAGRDGVAKRARGAP